MRVNAEIVMVFNPKLSFELGVECIPYDSDEGRYWAGKSESEIVNCAVVRPDKRGHGMINVALSRDW